jgi:translation initiation factor 3 subunit J
MTSWDDEDYEPAETTAVVAGGGGGADRWSGEDEDEDGLKDNWDDEEEEKDTSNVPKSQPKKKKTLADKIAEKEAAKREEVLAKMAQAEAERELTPDEVRRRQEEQDLELAKEAFGVDEVVPGVKTIDNFVPKTKEEFAELASMIVQKLTTLEYKTDFSYFLETLVRDSCAGREPEDIKKISNTLTLLANEKQKLNKDKNKGKKKAGATKKNTLAAGKGVAKAGYDDFGYDDYDDYGDFM